jgi:hypothetical protein
MTPKKLTPALPARAGHGPPDDGDNPGDEREDENEAPVRETDERMEAPAEFEVDEELDVDDESYRRRVGIVEALGSDRPPGNADAVESQADLAAEEDPDADDELEADDAPEADGDDDVDLMEDREANDDDLDA